MADELPIPTVVEHDGWTLASGSADRPTEAELKTALGAPAEAAPPAEEPPAEVVAPETETETPAEPLAAQPGGLGAEVPAQPQKKRTHDPQKRIDKITAELQAERARAIQLETEIRALRTPPPAREEPPPRKEAPPAGPKPTWGGETGFEAQGKSWEEYEDASRMWQREEIRAETARLVDERLKEERDRSTVEQQRSYADNAYLGRLNALRATRPDYDQVIEKLGTLDSPVMKHLIYYSPQGPALGLHLAEHRDHAEVLVNLPFTRPIVDALRTAEDPVPVLAYFAQHPDEFRALTRIDPVSAIRTIGRLEARLTVAPPVTTAAASPVTRARPPLRTVSGGAPQTRTAAQTVDDLPFSEEYVLVKNREDANRSQHRRGF